MEIPLNYVFHVLSYEDNVALTAKVVDYAHQHDVSVEGELGVLAGIEDDVEAAKSIYTVEGELGVLAGIEDDVEAAKSIYTDPAQVEDLGLILWQFPSAPHMEPTNSNRNNAPVMRKAFWSPHPCALIFSRRLNVG